MGATRARLVDRSALPDCISDSGTAGCRAQGTTLMRSNCAEALPTRCSASGWHWQPPIRCVRKDSPTDDRRAPSSGRRTPERSGSCVVQRQITWQDQWTANTQPSLTLYFSRSGLTGYQVGAPQQPRRPRGGWMLATARGLRVGDSLRTGRDLYGSSIALSANQGGHVDRSGVTSA